MLQIKLVKMESFPRDGKKPGIKISSDVMFEEHVKSKKHEKQKMKLRIVDEEMKQVNIFVLGEVVKGTVTKASLDGIYLKIQKNCKRNIVTGFLPAGHMAPCLKISVEICFWRCNFGFYVRH